MLQLLILSLAIIGIALIGLSVKMIFKKQGKFTGGSCQSYGEDLKDEGIGCGCGGINSCEKT
jgi:hypothetical protein